MGETRRASDNGNVVVALRSIRAKWNSGSHVIIRNDDAARWWRKTKMERQIARRGKKDRRREEGKRRGGDSWPEKSWRRAETRCWDAGRSASKLVRSSVTIIGLYRIGGNSVTADDRQATSSVTKDNAGCERREKSEWRADEWHLVKRERKVEKEEKKNTSYSRNGYSGYGCSKSNLLCYSCNSSIHSTQLCFLSSGGKNMTNKREQISEHRKKEKKIEETLRFFIFISFYIHTCEKREDLKYGINKVLKYTISK